MNDSVELDRTQQLVLVALLELTTPERSADTETVGNRVAELFRASGEAFGLHLRPPWWGVGDAARDLQDRGLVEIEVGMASYVPPGEPAPTVRHLYLDLTDAGREAARGLV